MNKKKRGRIKITENLYFDRDIMIELFKHFLPISVKKTYDGFIQCPALGYYILQGYADGFEEIKDEDIIPDYDPLFTRDAQNKNILLSFKKIK